MPGCSRRTAAASRRSRSKRQIRASADKIGSGDTTMPAKILIPTALRPYAANRDAIEVPGSTVGEAMANAMAQCPELKRHLYTEDGRLRSFVNVFVGDEDIRAHQNEQTPIKDGDEISVIPSIAGGVLAEKAPPDVELDNQEVARYSRHLIMPEVGL